jgi:hypothetical protein
MGCDGEPDLLAAERVLSTADCLGPAAMSARRKNLLEGVLGYFKRRVVLDSGGPRLRQVAAELWTFEGWEVWMLPGLALPCRTTIARLAGGRLIMIGAPPFSEEADAALAALGPLRFIVAPSTVHHLCLPSWAATHPGAEVYLPPAPRTRRPDLPAGRDLVEGLARPWSDEIDDAVFGPFEQVTEIVFLHRPSATLIATDLCFNLTKASSISQRLAWTCFGYPRRFGPSWSVRLRVLRYRTAVRPAFAKLRGWRFDRIIMAHGEIVENEAESVFWGALARYAD